jgi:Family of unknown function (DUF6524)
VAVPRFGFTSVGSRFLFAFAMVCLTWNPTRFNYVAWALAQWQDLAPLVAFVGIALAAGWFFFLRTTARSLGTLGLVLCIGLAATVLWTLFYYDIVSTGASTLLTWIVIVLFSAILAVGMSWAHLRARWSGQRTVDDVDEP